MFKRRGTPLPDRSVGMEITKTGNANSDKDWVKAGVFGTHLLGSLLFVCGSFSP